jgi:glycosyltransferase involved in cell wall biosynthesis
MTSFSFLSTFPPTRCGLATFTESLAAAVTSSGRDSARIVRVVDDLDDASPSVVGSRTTIVGDLRVDEPESVAAAARTLSMSDVVVVQHEYGIYGSDDGSVVVGLMRALTAPSIVVLHTVLEAPTDNQRLVLQQVAAAATAVVVMTESARDLLAVHYDVDMRHVSVIAHGADSWDLSRIVPCADRLTMLSWGLIGPGKGLEWGIRAVPLLADVYPEVHYEILGETHPKVVAHEGEAYRERLTLLAADLGVGDRVHFVDRYLDRAGVAARIAAADLVLLPYDSRTQITSGVLVESIAAGTHVVATAFPHALELLPGTDLGSVVAHESPSEIADAVRRFASRPAPVADAPAEPVLDTSWHAVAERYRLLVSTIREDAGASRATAARTA